MPTFPGGKTILEKGKQLRLSRLGDNREWMLKTLCRVDIDGMMSLDAGIKVAYCRVLHQPDDKFNVCQTQSNKYRMPDMSTAAIYTII